MLRKKEGWLRRMPGWEGKEAQLGRQDAQEEGRMVEKDVWMGRKRSIVGKDGQMDRKEKKDGKAGRKTVWLEE